MEYRYPQGNNGLWLQPQQQPQQKQSPQRQSVWDGYSRLEIPIFVDDRSIPRQDRFPNHPYGPVVPDVEHTVPGTARLDHDKLGGMMNDRMAVGQGDHSVLDKYRGQPAGIASDNPPAGFVQYAQGGMTATQPGHIGFGGQSGMTRTNPGHVQDNDFQCRSDYDAWMQREVFDYLRGPQAGNPAADPRNNPANSFEAFRSRGCR